MDGHTHGRYQTYYRPCYLVDKKPKRMLAAFCINVRIDLSHLSLRSRLDLAPKRLESRLSHHLITQKLKFL